MHLWAGFLDVRLLGFVHLGLYLGFNAMLHVEKDMGLMFLKVKNLLSVQNPDAISTRYTTQQSTENQPKRNTLKKKK